MFPKIEEGYGYLLKKFSHEFAVLNGSKNIDQVTEELLKRVNFIV